PAEIQHGNEYNLLVDQFLSKLQDFCPGLYFQVGGDPYEDQETIFSAAGTIEPFDKVTELVAEAPPIPGWKFVAFKPPMGPDFRISFEGIELDPREMWFQPLEYPDLPDAIGIVIGVPEFDEDREDELLAASYI